MREITGLNTKQIVNNLNKMRARYRTFKVKWDEPSESPIATNDSPTKPLCAPLKDPTELDCENSFGLG